MHLPVPTTHANVFPIVKLDDKVQCGMCITYISFVDFDTKKFKFIYVDDSFHRIYEKQVSMVSTKGLPYPHVRRKRRLKWGIWRLTMAQNGLQVVLASGPCLYS